MAFRDEREALRAQLGTLEAEVRRLQAAEATAVRERDEARAELERVVSERDGLQKRLARVGGIVPPSPAPRSMWTLRVLAPIGAAALAASTGALLLRETPRVPVVEPAPAVDDTTELDPEVDPAPAPPAPELPLDDLLAIRRCLDGVDAKLRLSLVAHDHVDADELARSARVCQDDLGRLGPLPSPLGPAVREYVEALSAVPQIMRRVQDGGPYPPISPEREASGFNPRHLVTNRPENRALIIPWRSASASVRSWLRAPLALHEERARATARSREEAGVTSAAARVELAAAMRVFLDAVAHHGDRAEAASRVREAAAAFGPEPPTSVPHVLAAVERLEPSRWLGPHTADAWLGLIDACAALACSDPFAEPARPTR